MRVDPDVVTYFKDLSADQGIPYQSLINLYLRDCMAQERQLNLSWRPAKGK